MMHAVEFQTVKLSSHNKKLAFYLWKVLEYTSFHFLFFRDTLQDIKGQVGSLLVVLRGSCYAEDRTGEYHM